MDNSDAVFFAVCGSIVGWIGVWTFVRVVVTQFNRNAPAGSRAKKAIDAITLIQVLPFLTLVPIFVIWTLGVKRPLQRWGQRRRGKKEVVKLRKRWAEQRREWAMSDLENARSEKEVLAEIEGVSSSMEQSDPVAAAGKSQLECLPAELRMEIYSYLDYGIALRLGVVSRSLRNDKPYESIEREQRATFVYHADTFQHNRKAGRLACYTCLRLRDKDEFSEDLRIREYKRFGVKETERRCFDCQVVKGEVAWGRVLSRRMDRFETKLWNRIVGVFKAMPSG
jgi:hypothetical protein